MEASIVNSIPQTQRIGNNFQRVVSLRSNNIQLTEREIAHMVGISHERVRQILTEANLPTRSQKPKELHKCHNCGESTLNLFFCSLKCERIYNTINLTCGVCGKTFPITKAKYNNKTKLHKRKLDIFFCSRQCYGSWFGKHYGRGRKEGITYV